MSKRLPIILGPRVPGFTRLRTRDHVKLRATVARTIVKVLPRMGIALGIDSHALTLGFMRRFDESKGVRHLLERRDLSLE